MNFPILRLRRDDFIDYYKQRGSSVPAEERFKKLSFLHPIGTGDKVTLLCYPLKAKREIMCPPAGIKLWDENYGNHVIDYDFILGTVELNYALLVTIIGPYNNIKTNFEYLRVEAKKEDLFIVYDVYFNDLTIDATRIRGNPCPPARQD